MAVDDSHAPLKLLERDGRNYRCIKEGKATILVPQHAGEAKRCNQEQQVFYNPIQRFNRDLSTLAIKAYGTWTCEQRSQKYQSKLAAKQGKKRKRDSDASPHQITTAEQSAQFHPESGDGHPEPLTSSRPAFKILDALSSSGLRALRYAHELDFVTSITANDLSASAAASIRVNVEQNGLQDIVTVTNQDALALMYHTIADGLAKRDRHENPSRAHKFDVVDLDPYGTAAPFFDAAVQAVRDDGGLLCITCTDSAVWAGHGYCEKSFALYGGVPINGLHSHEAALRLILHAIASSGARYGLAIEPLLSLSIDFYTKVFVRVTRSPQAVKFLGMKTMLVYSCDQGCGAWVTQPLLRSKLAPNKKSSGYFYKHGMALGPVSDRFCQHCGFKMHVSGPMYAGHIHHQDFIQRVLDEIPNASPEVYETLPRLQGMLRTAQEEFLPDSGAPHEIQSPEESSLAVIDNCPFFVIPGKLASTLSCATPSDYAFRGALKHLGYKIGRSHCRPGSIKTDAPWSAIWWVMTEWVRQKAPIKSSKFKPFMAAWKILQEAGLVGGVEADAGVSNLNAGAPDVAACDGQIISKEAAEVPHDAPESICGTEVKGAQNGTKESDTVQEALVAEQTLRKTLVFNEALEQLGRQHSVHFMRYQMNPQPNWGPLTKATRN